MPITTTIQCDCGCKRKIEIGTEETVGAEKILQVTDANAVKTFFMSIDCLRKWAATYRCPYQAGKPQNSTLDDVLPGLGEL